jgi:hypothetical protein
MEENELWGHVGLIGKNMNAYRYFWKIYERRTTWKT